MKRNIEKAISEYHRTFGRSKSNEGAFYVSDFEQIMKLSVVGGN